MRRIARPVIPGLAEGESPEPMNMTGAGKSGPVPLRSEPLVLMGSGLAASQRPGMTAAGAARPAERASTLQHRCHRHMVGGARPAARLARDRRPSASVPARSGETQMWSSRRPLSAARPVGRAVAPPRVDLRRARECRCASASTQPASLRSVSSASVSTGVWLTTSRSCLWLQTSCLERRDVEVADEDRGRGRRAVAGRPRRASRPGRRACGRTSG